MSELSSNKFLNMLMAIGFIVLLSLFVAFYWQNSAQSFSDITPASALINKTDAAKTSSNSSSKDHDQEINAAVSINASESHNELDEVFAEIVGVLKTEFGDQADNIAFQVSLKDIRNDLMVSYPEQGLDLFKRIIHAAFPEQATAIFDAIKKIDIYDQWLLDNMPDLNQMALVQQEEVLWTKRVELFGESAAEIWSEQLTPEQEREVSVQKTLKLLATAYDVPLEERLSLLKTSFEESYNGTIEGLIYDSRTVMAQAFFNFDSVQKDLKQLSNEQRQQQIDTIRRQLGYSEERIASLAQRDQEKEADWQKGYAYMKERALAEKNLSGEVLESELDKLREAYFSYRAPTIKNEEAGGFFRFTRPRVYGHN